VHSKHQAIIEVLVAFNADLEAVIRDGRTPLAVAVREANVSMARLLLTLGTDMAVTDRRGFPLVRRSTIEEMQQLVVEHEKKSVSAASIQFDCLFMFENTGRRARRLANGNIESNTRASLDSIDAACSARDHWHLSCNVVIRIAALCFAMDH
jgi:ankyrin repeat protein